MPYKFFEGVDYVKIMALKIPAIKIDTNNQKFLLQQEKLTVDSKDTKICENLKTDSTNSGDISNKRPNRQLTRDRSISADEFKAISKQASSPYESSSNSSNSLSSYSSNVEVAGEGKKDT